MGGVHFTDARVEESTFMQSTQSAQEATNQIPVNAIAQTWDGPGQLGTPYLCSINVYEGSLWEGGGQLFPIVTEIRPREVAWIGKAEI